MNETSYSIAEKMQELYDVEVLRQEKFETMYNDQKFTFTLLEK